MKKIRINKPEVVEHLVTNALAFVERGVDALKSDEVISAVCLSTAMELLLKARLAAEHWSLVFKDPDKASFKKFQDGNFQSATFEKVVERLRNITDTVFCNDERNVYDQISKHRNICVHFGADGRFKKGDPAIINKALVYLHKRMTEEWNALFFNNKADVQRLHRQISRLGPFIDEKYRLVQDEISAAKYKGADVVQCVFCRKDSCVETSRGSEKGLSIKHYCCKICKCEPSVIFVACQGCGKECILSGENVECDCGEMITVGDVVAMCETAYHDENSTVYLCSNCESWEPSVVQIGGEYVCLNCHSVFDDVGYCGWCNEGIAGIDEDTYFKGCHMCDGWVGHHADKD